MNWTTLCLQPESVRRDRGVQFMRVEGQAHGSRREVLLLLTLAALMTLAFLMLLIPGIIAG